MRASFSPLIKNAVAPTLLRKFHVIEGQKRARLDCVPCIHLVEVQTNAGYIRAKHA